jgi:hypothetical protein
MHRYREFGVVSEQDELFRRAFRDGFKRAGLSHAQFLDALAWYRDHARPEAGEAQLAESFAAFAAERGWPQAQHDGALGLYRAIRDDGPAAVAATPRPEEDRAMLARADELLRRDPAHYWRDGALQDAAFEARERLGATPPEGGSEMRPPDVSPDRQRIGEIETLLRDPSGAGQRRYWNDAALRADYAQALARVHGGGGTEGGGGENASGASDGVVAASP